jgi:TPR repeat protein
MGGQTEAYCCLGTCYEQGVGTEVNIPLAVQNYRRSAAQGSKVGMYSLGYLLVENAIDMRRQLKQMRPYVHGTETGGSRRSPVNSGVVAHTQQDEKYAYLNAEAEATLQEGIHWLRAASENHVKDAAFQLGRLYEQVFVIWSSLSVILL